jgi:hypothetical protein
VRLWPAVAVLEAERIADCCDPLPNHEPWESLSGATIPEKELPKPQDRSRGLGRSISPAIFLANKGDFMILRVATT